ncbi:flagella synthesis protein FlgN [Pseudomonas sp. Marseille-Q5115]|uniref:flagella synthesis protein FlgN n=1 Tax=Pseudomonas sp. Marseille-Q5115 TaxID=2866593 RepID=UPI001CE44170|nr:flagellar protein FlgN [Pseudomonas sp. Marseille-Q5115]
MHDTTLLQLIEDDIAPAEQLLALLREEYTALRGRDMVLLENILAHKQSLIVQLGQHGRRRSELLASMGLSPDAEGLAQLAQVSVLGKVLVERGEHLAAILAECQTINEQNGRAIQLQQFATANQLRILSGGEAPSLYTARGATARLATVRAFSQA